MERGAARTRHAPVSYQTARSTAECRSRAEPVGTFLELEASRQLVNLRYDGDRDFFTICSNGLGMKTLAH